MLDGRRCVVYTESMPTNAHVVIVAGQHGDEPLGLVVAQMLRRTLRPIVGTQRRIHFFGAINPEGLARGRRVRDDDVDPNRVWGTEEQAWPQASVMALVDELVGKGESVVVIDCHSGSKPTAIEVAGPIGAGLLEVAGVEPRVVTKPGTLSATMEARGVPCLATEPHSYDPSQASVVAIMVMDAVSTWVRG